MRILVFGINYAPELTGIGKYTAEMCEWLASKKHSVTAITANPYYPEWSIHPGYKNWYSKQNEQGVEVLRSPIYIPKKVSGLSRIIHELSFVCSCSVQWIRVLFRKKYDTVICIAPPFYTGLYAYFYGFLKGAKSIYHIQDLQVDAAQELGLIKSQIIINVLRSLEKWILSRVDITTSISDGMISKIATKNEKAKIVALPNWVDIDFIKPLSKEESLRAELGFDKEDFIVLYSGNLGEKQGLEIIIDAAKNLRMKYAKIKFLICGEGAYRNELVRLAEGSDNIFFKSLQPYNKLPGLLASADIHLILQKRAAADLVLPSKLTSIAASGGFSLVAAEENTSLYETVTQYEIGLIIEPENAESLEDGIEKSYTLDLNVYEKNARTYAEEYLNKDKILNNFVLEL